ncbi:MAG: hypothetical protein K8T91_25440 [Planctomycetes bacterium]|nr:hypothetical protein [Planctomycetota bacterium]
MRCLTMVAAVALLSLSSASTLSACDDRGSEPAQQYVPQSQPESIQVAAVGEGVRMAGAGFGGAAIAGAIAWSVARRKA